MADQHESAPLNSMLEESERRYRAVIENASDMIQSCLPDGSFEFVNRAWLDKMGYTQEEVDQMNIWDVIHPGSREHCEEVFMRAVQGEQIDLVRAIFLTRDGRPLPVEGNATSRFVDGEVIATHSFFRDITERIRAEELEERNAQLEREQVARYLEKMAALGKLSAGLAHELNNPAAAAQRAGAQMVESIIRRDEALTELHRVGLDASQWKAIDDFIERIRRPLTGGRSALEISELEEALIDWLDERGVEDGWELAPPLVHEGVDRECLEGIVGVLPPEALRHMLRWVAESRSGRDLAEVVTESTRRISELVSAVKAYSYMDRAVEQVVDIHEGIENTLVILAHRLKHVAIRRHYAEDVPKVSTVGSGLNQVWTNILDNASDVLDEHGVVTITTRRSDEGVVVEIEDNGPGIAPEHQSRVFEPFFSTKPQGKGTGLGLDTAWRIVTEEHGGRIDLESGPGRTMFRITLPANGAAS